MMSGINDACEKRGVQAHFPIELRGSMRKGVGHWPIRGVFRPAGQGMSQFTKYRDAPYGN